MKTMWERQEERRAEKLAEIRDQVEKGTLRIRQMTAKERAENPPQPRRPGSRGTPRRPRKAPAD
ncbi:MAG: hypothetical protein ACRDLF_01270 [Solirubrobacteraceae bacterium]